MKRTRNICGYGGINIKKVLKVGSLLIVCVLLGGVLPNQLLAMSEEETEALTFLWEYKTNYEIKKVSISSDGNYIAAIGDNYDTSRNDVLLLLTKNKDLLWEKDSRKLFEYSNWIHDVSLSENATYIAVGSENGFYLLQRDGKILQKTGNYSYVQGMNFISISDNGEYIAIGTYEIGDGWIYLFNKAGDELWNYRALDSVHSVAISKDGEYITACDTKSYVYLFNKEGDLLWDKKVVGDPYSFRVSISSNGEFIGVGRWGSISIVNRTGNWELEPVRVEHGVEDISITEKADFLFVAAGEEGLCIYNANGDFISSFKARENVLSVATTPDGTHLVVGSDDMRVYYLEFNPSSVETTPTPETATPETTTVAEAPSTPYSGVFIIAIITMVAILSSRRMKISGASKTR